ncbi:hypothetical protein Hanom_Chr14g01261461 [Helianthus anomalus]
MRLASREMEKSIHSYSVYFWYKFILSSTYTRSKLFGCNLYVRTTYTYNLPLRSHTFLN